MADVVNVAMLLANSLFVTERYDPTPPAGETAAEATLVAVFAYVNVVKVGAASTV